jgi:WhiB family redox-sensing transcriptional regulator
MLLALPSTPRDSWLDDAGCTTVPVEVFYGTEEHPLTHTERAQAKDICKKCPVQFNCLEHSLITREYWGIWGGLDERERRAVMKEYKTIKAAIQAVKDGWPA